MNCLDFMIVGVQKAGTSALSHFLSQHPNIVMAKGKEVHLFDAPNYSPDWTLADINQQYAHFFPADTEQRLCGEATPIYVYFPNIAAELKRYNSALKLILILRDPVERALSHYVMERSRGNERLPLWLALLLEPLRLRRKNAHLSTSSQRCHSYVSRGLYAKQLQNLRLFFPDEQILIIDNTELLHEHQSTLEKVHAFLGVTGQEQVKAEKIFIGEYHKKNHKCYYWWLARRFRRANKELKEQLLNMGYRPTWQWLR